MSAGFIYPVRKYGTWSKHMTGRLDQDQNEDRYRVPPPPKDGMGGVIIGATLAAFALGALFLAWKFDLFP